MKLVRIIVLIAVIVGFYSCKKKVSTFNPDLIGVWTGSYNNKEYTLTIVEEGKSTYYENWSDTAYAEAKGVARIAVKKNDNDILVIGKKDLTIKEDKNIDADIQYPTEVLGTDPHYQLILDGITYRKEM